MRKQRPSLVTLMSLLVIPVIGMAISIMTRSFSPWVSVLYIGMSVVAFVLYGMDKHRAQTGQWRIAESTLHGVALFGGWPGAFLAQQHYRHKTKKQSFVIVFWGIVLLHQLFWIDQGLLGGTISAQLLR